MKFNIGSLSDLGVIGIIGMLGVSAYNFYKQRKATHNLTEKIGISMSEIEKRTPVDIQEAVIDRAVRNAVERKVSYAVQEAVNNVSAQIRGDMDKEIRKDVDGVYDQLRGEVEDRVTQQVATIDVEGMRKSVQRKAEEKVFKDFCSFTGIGKMFGLPNNGSSGYGTKDLSAISDILDHFWSDSDKQKALNTLMGNRS